MAHEYLTELKGKLMKELRHYSEAEINASNLGIIDTLAHAAKNVCKLIDAEEEKDGGFSYREGMSRRDGGSSNRMGKSYDDGSYDEGGSYRRKRDSMGRYSRTGMIDHLRELMESAPDERTREKLRQMIGDLDQ